MSKSESTENYLPRLKPLPSLWDGRFPVSETFYSLQGEGRWSGSPSVFVRFNYCNFGCSWCDTRYTWDERAFDDGEKLTPSELASRMRELAPDAAFKADLPHVVITGGEPLLHQAHIPALIAELRTRRFTFFEVETHGAIEPSREMLRAVSWWNVSPKLSNSMLPSNLRVNPDAIHTLAATGRADFKFVVRQMEDVDELEHTYGRFISPDQILLMPEGAQRRMQLSVLEQVAEWCRQRGYRLSPRLHTLIWNNQRGV